MPDEAPNANTSQTIGKVTLGVLHLFVESSGGNLLIGEGFIGSLTTERQSHYLRYHRGANAETPKTRKISAGRKV